MKNTIQFIENCFVLILFLITTIHAQYPCSCLCCIGQNCQSATIGYVYAPYCTADSCSQTCRDKYYQCSAYTPYGQATGQCISGTTIAPANGPYSCRCDCCSSGSTTCAPVLVGYTTTYSCLPGSCSIACNSAYPLLCVSNQYGQTQGSCQGLTTTATTTTTIGPWLGNACSCYCCTSNSYCIPTILVGNTSAAQCSTVACTQACQIRYPPLCPLTTSVGQTLGQCLTSVSGTTRCRCNCCGSIAYIVSTIMEKQGSLSHWNVKMMPIDIDVTVNQLAQIIGLPMKRISFLKTNDNTSRYALVNGFVNKQEADNFVMKMSDLRISGEPVRCVADPPHLSSQSTTSSSKSFNDIGHQPQSNRGTKNRPNNNNNISSTFVPIMPINTNGRPNFVKDHENKSTESTLPSSHQNQNTAPDIKELNETFQSSNESGQLSSANNSVESKVVDSSEPQPHSSTPYQGRLCSYANKGNCRYKDGECKYRHTRCLNFDSCEKPDCRLAHAKLPSAQTTTQPEIGTSKPCFNGILCYKGDCPFDHPKDWNPCQNGSLCRNYDCIARHPPNYKGRCRNADRCNNKHNCEYLHPIMPSSLPKEPSKIIIELSSAEQNFLENFGKKILDTIREKPDIEDLKIKDGKLQLIGKNLISTNIESYLKQVLHERRITISFSMKKYLELQCKGHLLKKFREKYRVGISYRNSIENASLTTNDMIKLKNRTGNYNQDEQEKQFDNNYDMEQSEDESEDFTDNKSDISNTSSNITSISGKFQHRHPCVQQNIEVNLCTDSEDLISNAIQELGNYTFDIRSLALTQEEVTYILKQSQQPNRFPQKNNKFQSKTLQIKRYIDSLTRSGVNSIVTNFIKYKNGLYFIKVKGFKDHVNNAVSKIKNYLNDHVDTEVQLSISQAMAVYLRTKGSFDLRKLEKTHSVEIKIFSPPFANRMNDEQNDKNDCIKLTGSESRIRAAQINVDNFLESLSEQEKQFPCDSWDAAKFITQTLREKFKKMLDSDDCEAIGWIKVYTPAEKREITPKLTITIVGFNEETVADVVEQCQDIVGGYIIWKPSIDEYRTISNAFFRTKSLSLEEFGRQWNTDIQMDRVTSTITIAAQSKMIAEDIKEALLTLGEENKPRVNRISEFISIQPRIRRFVNQAIASLIEEARY
ncbi:unnamed protein product, partial [Adineta steineri]